MNCIQNDVDGVDQHHNAWQSLFLFIGDVLFITSHSYDAVLSPMMVLDYIRSICCFGFFFTCVVLVILYCRRALARPTV